MNLGKEKLELLKEKWPFIEPLDEYKTIHTQMSFLCKDCGHKWKTTMNAVLRSKCGCPKCKVQELTRKHMIEKAKPFFENDFDFLGLDCNGHHIKFILRCKKCGNIRCTNSNNLKRFGCKKCSSQKTGRKLAYTNEKFIEIAKAIHGNIYDYSKTIYVQNKQKIIVTCPKHGDFLISPNKHICDQQGCPICHGSGLEKITYELLQELKIPFTRELPIKYNNKQMYVDFAIEINEQKYFIELNGAQHYIPVDHWGGQENLEKQQLRDQLLQQYCDENNIKLFVIRFDQVVRTELLKIIFKITAAPTIGEKLGKNGEP